MTSNRPPQPPTAPVAAPLQAPELASPKIDDEDQEESQLDLLEDILDDIRTRKDETPQWEFCEGFMTALICCRRIVHASEYLPVLLDTEELNDKGEGAFADDAQLERFMTLWVGRWNEIAQALNTRVESLGDERAYRPEIMDVRGALAAEPPDPQDVDPDDEVPALAQVWALGFMFMVETWPDEWVPPRDKKTAKWMNDALDAIVALTEDDTDPPTLNCYEESGPPSVSQRRLDEVTEAIWATYDLRALMADVGPRVATVHNPSKIGRNDPCHCGSGKKFKKCHGA